MRIATVCNLPPPFGGAEVFAKKLVFCISKKGAELSVFTQKMFEIQLTDSLDILKYLYVQEDQFDLIDQGIKIYPLYRISLSRNLFTISLNLPYNVSASFSF